jgi:hypothetical protein
MFAHRTDVRILNFFTGSDVIHIGDDPLAAARLSGD